MIFVTVGTHNYGFNRLVSNADELASNINMKVFIQYGNSDYPLKYAEGIKWLDSQKMNFYLSSATVIITHAGAGSILSAIQVGKPFIVVPRNQEFKEHIDNHQFQLARKMEETNWAIVVYEPSVSNLTKALNYTLKIESKKIHVQSNLILKLNEQLENWRNQF